MFTAILGWSVASFLVGVFVGFVLAPRLDDENYSGSVLSDEEKLPDEDFLSDLGEPVSKEEKKKILKRAKTKVAPKTKAKKTATKKKVTAKK